MFDCKILEMPNPIFCGDVTSSMAVLLQVSQFKSKLGGGGEGVDYKDVIKFYKL